MINVVHNENCITGLKKLPDNFIDCCVTSPPYYGLRDYGTEEQIGLEETPEKFVESLVNVFSEVRRVLKSNGTLWLNLGDSYAAERGGTHQSVETLSSIGKGKIDDGEKVNRGRHDGYNPTRYASKIGLKHKDLIGIPWMVAFALRSAGWYLRQDIIWHKPNPMPESVKDRCTKCHEYIFLLSKSANYYYDYEIIMQDSICKNDARNGKGNIIYDGKRSNQKGGGQHSFVTVNDKANKRSVWTVTTKPFSDAHFATFPEDLIVDCIKAGCPEDGIVLDPFMGAGTTAVVAKKLNRNYIGYELNPSYISIIKKRMHKEFGLFLNQTK